jgi:hypothetical protein
MAGPVPAGPRGTTGPGPDWMRVLGRTRPGRDRTAAAEEASGVGYAELEPRRPGRPSSRRLNETFNREGR